MNRQGVAFDANTPVNLKVGELTPSGSDYVVTPAALGAYLPLAGGTMAGALGPIVPKASGSGTPARTLYSGTKIFGMAFAVNDICDIRFHIPHDYAPGTDLYIHAHWSHNGTAISGNLVIDYYLTYAKGHNQANFSAQKNQTFTYNTTNIATMPQYRHRSDDIQLSTVGGSATLLNTTDIEPDGYCFGEIVLTGLPTITGGDLFIHTIDLHYQSTGIGTKQKAPNFYV